MGIRFGSQDNQKLLDGQIETLLLDPYSTFEEMVLHGVLRPDAFINKVFLSRHQAVQDDETRCDEDDQHRVCIAKEPAKVRA